MSNVGESWELSGVPGSESKVEGGPDDGLTLSEVIDRHGASLMGKRNYQRFGNKFPLLIKIIDAAQDLSIQVHPGDELARKRGHANGKNEMWYVVAACKSKIADGFNRDVDPAELDSLLESSAIEKTLNYIDIAKGDVFYIPAGRVHSLGAGAMVIEVQQTSDLTYRLYDYHRRDAQGKERELHVNLARKAIDYSAFTGGKEPYALRMNIPSRVLKTPEFTTNVVIAESEFMRDYNELDTFVVLVCTEGEAEVTCGDRTMPISRGQTLLVPADVLGVIIAPRKKTTLLETYVY